MTRFMMEDDDNMSGDRISDIVNGVVTSSRYANRYTFEDIGVPKLNIPGGRCNSERLLNLNMYDLLYHIQMKMSMQNKCILEYITDAEHVCPNWGDNEVKRKIINFASKYVNDDLREEYPRIIKEDYTEDDEDWFARLCHIVMQHKFPKRLQMIKCEQCLQRWMNSSKW